MRRLAMAVAVAPAALGILALLFTNPHGDGFRIIVKGQSPFEDVCLAAWLRREHPSFTTGGGATPAHVFVLAAPANGAGARVSASIAEGDLDVTVAWPDGFAEPNAVEPWLRTMLQDVAASCGVRSWTAVCAEASPGAQCPSLRAP